MSFILKSEKPSQSNFLQNRIIVEFDVNVSFAKVLIVILSNRLSVEEYKK